MGMFFYIEKVWIWTLQCGPLMHSLAKEHSYTHAENIRLGVFVCMLREGKKGCNKTRQTFRDYCCLPLKKRVHGLIAKKNGLWNQVIH